MEQRATTPSSVGPNRLSLGALAMILAGLAQLPTGILRAGVPSGPARNLEFALGANSFAFRLGMTLTCISLSFFILGLIALYAYLSRTKAERLALVGLVVTVGFLVVWLPLLGFISYLVPAVGVLAEGGHPEMVQVMDQAFREPFIVIPFFAGILSNFGMILLGVAIWRSGRLWKWGGLLFFLFGVLNLPLDVEVLSFVASALLGFAQLAVGVTLFRAVRSEAPTSTAVPGAFPATG